MDDEPCDGESSLDMTLNAGFLPRDVLVKIFSYCSFNDLAKSFQFVCSWWQDASRERCLWKHFSYEPRGVTKEEIINMFRICPQLKAVNLMSVTIDEEIFLELIVNCPYLEVLSISWDAVYELINLAIIQPLTNIKTLKLSRKENMIIDFEHVNNIFPNLEHLEFDVLFCRLKDLMIYLQEKRNSLHTLSLPCCSDDGCCILPYTEACSNLKTLSLRNLCDSVESVSYDEVRHLKNITSLTFHYSDVGAEGEDGTVFKFFPNIVELRLYVCTQTSGKFLYELSLSCPALRKLTISNEWHGLGSVLQDHNLEQLSNLKSLTHLTIRFNGFITDEGIKYLEEIPCLTYLDLYDCEQVTIQCLKVVCSFSKLEVFKFDLQYNDLPIDLTTDYVKNKNLQLRFYNCNDLSVLQHLKKKFPNVGVIEENHC
ncbi:F-box/LRR-repeat protein 20 [Anabrus simplex]|uniref:F-box/LRR-repeat protein 20 n=1 Tax=Anabrus simplex TaxID=316456 RepID=UPI0034DCD050